jgi:CheY-like chemotaxis protein
VADDLRLIGIALAGKIAHPSLLRSVEGHLNNANPQIARAAREIVLEHHGSAGGTIQSIFVLDDSRYMTNQLSALLVKSGYRVTAENNVREGLLSLYQGDFDLLILDLEMPEMDGLQFLKAAREAKAAPEHVLIITSNRDRENLQRVASQGIGGLFLKPFPMQDLIQKIKAIEAA